MKEKRIRLKRNFQQLARELFFKIVALEEVSEVKLDEATKTVIIIVEKVFPYQKVRDIFSEMQLEKELVW